MKRKVWSTVCMCVLLSMEMSAQQTLVPNHAG